MWCEHVFYIVLCVNILLSLLCNWLSGSNYPNLLGKGTLTLALISEDKLSLTFSFSKVLFWPLLNYCSRMGFPCNKCRRVFTWDMFSLLSYLCSLSTGLYINIIYFQLVTFSLPQPNLILLARMPTIAREFPGSTKKKYHNLLSELSKASGHKANVQKSVVFLLY